MADRDKISDDDAELFRQAVGKVTPLQGGHRHVARKRVPPIPRQRYEDEHRVMQDLLTDAPLEDLECGDELLFHRPGIQHGVVRKLRRGHYSIDAELDLHGMTAVVARQALSEFLRRCRHHGARCVRIIHGKGLGSVHGRPVLKQKVNGWLQQRDEVLAFCSAPRTDGGTGAVYVLLKRA